MSELTSAGGLRVLALNVRTLSIRLAQILSLPFDVFCLSEVRVAGNSMRAQARVASSLGCAVVWSAPPPPSPTFLVSPGGTAILVRQPYMLEEMRVPALEKWRSEARICVASVTDAEGMSMCFASCYGYPISHPNRGANEAYLRDTLSFLGRLMCPAVLLGDLNDHPSTSDVLAQSHLVQMHRITDESPTTLTKDGDIAARTPIDHCFVNQRAVELAPRVRVDSTLRISDHLPILLRLATIDPRVMCAEWAMPLKKLPPKVANIPWVACPLDYPPWQEVARQWLQAAHSQSIPPKGVVAIRPYKAVKSRRAHLKFRRLLTLQKAVLELDLYPREATQESSICRKVLALGYQRWVSLVKDPKALRKEVAAEVTRLTHVHHRQVMKGWKKKVKKWHVSDAAVYRFLKNPKPSGSIAIRHEEAQSTHPQAVEASLSTYWNGLETWTPNQQEMARCALDDYYSFLLPRFEFEALLLPMHLCDKAKRAKPSAVGLDGWTHQELAALPMQAWYSFLIACSLKPLSLLSSVSAVFKRAPLPKTSSCVCLPMEIRPIDLFSVVMRIHASAATTIVKPWALKVLHPGQYATQGGVLVAVSRIAWNSERSLTGCATLRGISVDFEKMFNMLSGFAAAEVAQCMGLSYVNIMHLVVPLAGAVGVWKLPLSAAPTPFATPRGLPQGMASSVLLAELAISPLLWRFARAMPEVDICAYVDDLNLTTSQEGDLTRVVGFLRDFESHFSLSLSTAKTKIWASDIKNIRTWKLSLAFRSTSPLRLWVQNGLSTLELI